VATVTVGFTLGVLWEFYEWFGNAVLHFVTLVGYDDTIADLAMDGPGPLLAGLGVVVWLRRNLAEASRPARSGSPLSRSVSRPSG
jgi:uncharacterized iron-regulated membrane protein